MSTTVKELAQKLHLKRNSIEMRMSQIPDFRKKYVTRKGNKLIISDEGSKLICKLHGKPRTTVNDTVNVKVNDRVNDYKIDTLKKLLKQERGHNDQLRKQLDTVNDSNKHLGKLLDQQQQLQLATSKENNQLKGQIKHLKEIPAHVVNDTNNSEDNAKKAGNNGSESNNSKKGFWSRFFNKL